ncbi:unnamed protein product [Brassica rapa subsp. trilocularis]
MVLSINWIQCQLRSDCYQQSDPDVQIFHFHSALI